MVVSWNIQCDQEFEKEVRTRVIKIRSRSLVFSTSFRGAGLLAMKLTEKVEQSEESALFYH